MTISNKPAKNTKWIMGNHSLPQDFETARYKATDSNGKIKLFTASKRQRQVVEALSESPLYCASPIRLSHYVDLLREQLGDDAIATDWYSVKEPFPNRYGVYRFNVDIEFLGVVSEPKQAVKSC